MEDPERSDFIGAGARVGHGELARRLQEVGCDVYGQDELIVTVPSWRPDLTDPNDLAEEVIRLEGYENLPSTLPKPPAGRGLTHRQRLHRRVGRALAGAGYVEAPNYPFIGEQVFDQLGLEADDPARRVVRLTNPLNDEEPALRTVLSCLLENAFVHAPPGSEVRVALEPGATVQVRVENAAPDLTEADLAHFGEPFWRRDPARAGDAHAGLGLALATALSRTADLGLRFSLSAGRLSARLRLHPAAAPV